MSEVVASVSNTESKNCNGECNREIKCADVVGNEEEKICDEEEKNETSSENEFEDDSEDTSPKICKQSFYSFFMIERVFLLIFEGNPANQIFGKGNDSDEKLMIDTSLLQNVPKKIPLTKQAYSLQPDMKFG
jgi:hypothetical protein